MKNKKQKDILYIAISAFFLTALWVGFNLYHAWATSTISPDLQIQITPIAPDFDTQTLDKLKSRQAIQPVYELKNTESASPTPSPSEKVNNQLEQTVTPSPIAQPTGTTNILTP